MFCVSFALALHLSGCGSDDPQAGSGDAVSAEDLPSDSPQPDTPEPFDVPADEGPPTDPGPAEDELPLPADIEDPKDHGSPPDGSPPDGLLPDGSLPDSSEETAEGVDVEPPQDVPPPDNCECDDQNPCTLDKCVDPATGLCDNIPVPLACDDGDPCSVGDKCQDGACEPGFVVADCNDGNPCTEGQCITGEGCVQGPTAEGVTCDDADTCTTGETCQSGACAGGTLPDCADDDQCTLDQCENGVGCTNTVDSAACKDDESCTFDLCDSKTGCTHPALEDDAACDDGDPCTLGDGCSQGLCTPGEDALPCNDKNACTTDQCVPGEGCAFAKVGDGAACDDKNDATVDDQCKQGKCKGVADDCAAFLGLQFPTMKVTSLFVGTVAAEALDVDGDGTLDNNLAPIGPFINGELSTAISSGAVKYVAHLQGFNDTLDPFDVHFFLGALAPNNPTCDFQGAVCDYLVQEEAFDAACSPVSSFPGVIYNGSQLLSDGGGVFTLAFAFGGELNAIALHKAKVEINLNVDGSTVTSFVGKLGGAIDKQELVELANLIESPLPLGDIVSDIIDPDIDIDGDGTMEGVSVHLNLAGLGANILGVAPTAP